MNIAYLHEFLEELEGLDKPARAQIRKKLTELYRSPEGALVHQPLKGAQFKGLCKLRVGEWRLIYKVSQGQLVFITLGHRSSVYR